ncbi:MAG TPA: GGDEF domain-containing protein [bacterium]|nr:GGDEF domain-containing protein [bacterium]
MATFTYAAVLALIRVIQRATIEESWVDFVRAYDLPRVDVDARRYAHMAEGSRVVEALRDLATQIDTHPDVKRFFERAAEAVPIEFLPPSGRDVLGLGRVFLGLDNFSGEGDEAAAYASLYALRKRLEEGGYRLTDAGRLVADDAPPPDHELDALTGIRTRGPLKRDSDIIVQECRTAGVSCGAVFVDIDNFKRFNEEHGHDVADDVLRAVANTIDRSLSLRGGVVGRYGGEEIVATARNLTEAEVASLGERIREEVANQKVRGLSVTVSVGVASARDGTREALWVAADKAMLAAKRRGKNQVVRGSEV